MEQLERQVFEPEAQEEQEAQAIPTLEPEEQ